MIFELINEKFLLRDTYWKGVMIAVCIVNDFSID